MRTLLIVAGAVILVISVLYALMWIPVVDRVINPCKYYPDFLIDCKE